MLASMQIEEAHCWVNTKKSKLSLFLKSLDHSGALISMFRPQEFLKVNNKHIVFEDIAKQDLVFISKKTLDQT